MKEIITAGIFFLLPAGLAYAQTLTVSAGLKAVNVKKGELVFYYRDESPVPDLLYKTVNFKGKKMAWLISADYETSDKINKPYLGVKAQGYLNEIAGADIGAGAGYRFGGKENGKFSIAPELALVYGINQLKLGTLSVRASGSVYITVNDTRFDDYEDVAILLRNTYLTLKPGLKINCRVNNKIRLRLYGAYQVGEGKATIRFSGLNNNGEKSTEVEKLAGQNIYFTLNGNRISKPPFTARGVELSAGLTYGF
jgi:hypothetical protein